MAKNKNASALDKAEEARERRKKNIQKQNEQAAKRAERKRNETPLQKRLKVIIPVAVAVLVILCFFLNFFGVFSRASTAIKIEDGTKISKAETEYYYRMYYNYYVQMANQYDTYYSSYYGEDAGKTITGFDWQKSPDNQKFTPPTGQDLTLEDKYGDDATWADYFEQESINQAIITTKLYNEAVKNGAKLTKAQKAELDDSIEQLRTSAKDQDYSLNAYLRTTYGKGMNEKLFRDIYEKQTIVNAYQQELQDKYSEKVTDEEVQEAFNKNKQDYTTVTLRNYAFAPNLTEDDNPTKAQIKEENAKNKALAEAFLAEATDANFSSLCANATDDETMKTYYETSASYSTLEDTTYENVSSTMSKEAADWAYADTTVVGSKKLFTIKNDLGLKTYFILLETKGPSRDESYNRDVRHILFMVSDVSDDSEEATAAATHTDEEAKKLAEDTLAKWKAGKATDETFAALATKLTEDSGSQENGGLYEDVTPSSSYVPEFLNWIFADGRQVGDTGIVKTDYGYHIMYLKSIDSEPVWVQNVRTAIATENYNNFYKSLQNKDNDKVKYRKFKGIRKSVEKTADTVITNMQTSSQTQGLAY